MKAIEIQMSTFGKKLYRTVLKSSDEKTMATKWFNNYTAMRATLKNYRVDIPARKDIRFFPGGFGESHAPLV